MAIGVIAKLKIKPGVNQDFEDAFIAYQETVKGTEAGNLFFSLHRSRTDDCAYTVMEQYVDETALEEHMSADYYKAIPETFGEFMAGPPDIEYLDSVV